MKASELREGVTAYCVHRVPVKKQDPFWMQWMKRGKLCAEELMADADGYLICPQHGKDFNDSP